MQKGVLSVSAAKRITALAATLSVGLLLLAGCSADLVPDNGSTPHMPAELPETVKPAETEQIAGPAGWALPVCPETPNCVSSDASPADSEHYIAPFIISSQMTTEQARQAVYQVVFKWPRTRIINQNQNNLVVEYRSALWRFVDDVHLQLRPGQRLIAVYSSSRLGFSDFGANRQRLEGLRAVLVERGVVEPLAQQAALDTD